MTTLETSRSPLQTLICHRVNGQIPPYAEQNIPPLFSRNPKSKIPLVTTLNPCHDNPRDLTITPANIDLSPCQRSKPPWPGSKFRPPFPNRKSKIKNQKSPMAPPP